MKSKIVLISGIILCLSTVSKAQTYFGISGGLNMSNMTKVFMGESTKGTYKFGFQAGAFAQIGLTYTLDLQTEINFSQMGVKYTDEGSALTSEMNYLTLPLLLKFRMNEFAFYTGPQMAYLLSSKDVYESGSVNMDFYYKKTDFSVVVGAEYVIREQLIFGLRYQNSLTQIAKNTDLGPSIKNNVFTFKLGYLF